MTNAIALLVVAAILWQTQNQTPQEARISFGGAIVCVFFSLVIVVAHFV